MEDRSFYRPISLLPIMSKVFEKLLLDRLLPIITERGLISNRQFGFRQHHSTIEQIHRVTQVINQTIDEKSTVHQLFWTSNKLLTKSGMMDSIKAHTIHNRALIVGIPFPQN
jgi:hypothetical protein